MLVTFVPSSFCSVQNKRSTDLRCCLQPRGKYRISMGEEAGILKMLHSICFSYAISHFYQFFSKVPRVFCCCYTLTALELELALVLHIDCCWNPGAHAQENVTHPPMSPPGKDPCLQEQRNCHGGQPLVTASGNHSQRCRTIQLEMTPIPNYRRLTHKPTTSRLSRDHGNVFLQTQNKTCCISTTFPRLKLYYLLNNYFRFVDDFFFLNQRGIIESQNCLG